MNHGFACGRCCSVAIGVTIRMDGGSLLERLTIRTVLLTGFGLMIGLWLFAGYQITQRLQNARRESTAVGARYQHAGIARVRAHSGAGSVSIAPRRAARTGHAGQSWRRNRARVCRHRLAADASMCRSSTRPRSASRSPVCAGRSPTFEWSRTTSWQPIAAVGRPRRAISCAARAQASVGGACLDEVWRSIAPRSSSSSAT